MNRFLLGIFLFFIVWSANAQPFSDFQTNIFTENQYYLSPTIRKEQTDLYSNMGFEMYGQEEKTNWIYELQINGRLSLDAQDSHYLTVPSAHIGWQLKDIPLRSYLNYIRVSLGRHINEWSLLDKKWHLGIWTPHNFYDPLRPIELGHFGSTITFGGKYWSLTNFVGGLFFPDERLSFDVTDSGEVFSSSRWVTVPNTNISFSEQDVFSAYIIEEPYLKNVLLQSTYMGNLLLGDRDNKWLSFSFAEKPLNQIFFRSRSGFSVPSEVFENTIYYHSVRHNLIALESGFKVEKWKLYLGVLNEQIDLVDLPANWLFPIVPNYFFASAGLSIEFNWGDSFSNFLDLSLLRGWLTNPNRSPSQDIIGEDIDSMVYLERLKIRDGFSISWSSVFSPYGRKSAKFFIQYWYSFEQEGAWLTAQLSILFLKNLHLDLETDILGKRSQYNTGFLGQYGNNDRLIARMRYIF